MKFCSECGTKFVGLAKFCGECGKPRADAGNNETISPGGEDLDWQTFVKAYKPKKNQFAEVNEALDGCFFPSWGAVGDWTSFEELSFIWSVLASEGPFMRLQCKSGRWNGPNVIGYLFCEISVPDDDDLAFHLPENYTGFQGFILKVDEETDKWRPCRYRLKGDSTESIDVDKIATDGSEDEHHRDIAELSKFSRASSQVMARITLEDSEKRDTYAEKLDSRYFMLVSSPAWGWIDYYVEEYEPMGTYLHLGEEIDDYENMMIFNVPHSNNYYERISRCTICDAEEDSDAEEYSDHSCLDGDIQGKTFASFNTDAKLQYIRAHIPLPDIQKDEAGFRERVLPYLLREFKAGNISGFDHFERQENEMADSSFQLAFNREMFAWDRLTKACGSCFKYNPESAQVCYNCCNQFVKEIDGQIFASIIRDVDTDQIDEMEPEEFAAWVHVFYYVAKPGTDVAFVVPPTLESQQIAADLSEKIKHLIGVEGFFNFDATSDAGSWCLTGYSFSDGGGFLLNITGKLPKHQRDLLCDHGWGEVDENHFEKWHDFTDIEECTDAVTFGLGWLQLISGAKPETWSTKLEVHLGA